MDEKTAMNVEFLRARLLSERIVSKTARQRAEMLSQRVIELEKQLRIVNIQRKKAEKAAEEVLSILETQGITCISGSTDSSTDQENNQLTDQEGNQHIISEDVKEDILLKSSRKDRSEVDDGLSCSDIDGTPSDYNCLSWKSNGSTLDSQDKLKTKQNRHRQRSSFIITTKSSQRRFGKSCRKILRPDVGSVSDNESQQKPTLFYGNGAVAHPDDFDEKHEYPLETFESKMGKFSVDSSLPFCSDGRNRESKDGGGKDNMERALEQQAQLIIQFQAMENAQKEWEEKFNETKMPMLDNLEPGNQVNVVENTNCSPDKSKLVGWIPQHKDEEKISLKNISPTEHKNAERCRICEMADEKVESGDKIETVSKSFTFPPQDISDSSRKAHFGPNFEKSITSSERNLKSVLQCSSKEHLSHPSQSYALVDLRGSNYEKPNSVIHRNSNMNFREHSFTEKLTPITDDKEFPEVKEPRGQISRPIGSALGSVLQSLQRARMSVRQELVKMPNSALTTMTVSAPASSPINPNVPIDSSVLFKLPSDSFPRALSRPTIYGSRLRLTATRPDLGLTNTTEFSGEEYLNQHHFSPYMDGGVSRVQVRNVYANQNPNRFVESDSRLSTVEKYFDRRANSSISASSSGAYPLYYPDLSSKSLPFHNELSDLRSRKPYSDR